MAAGEPEVPAKPEPAPKKPEPQSQKGTPSQQVDKAQEPAHAEAKDTRSPENDAVAQALAELSKERPLPETPEEPPVKDWTEATPKEQAPALSETPAIGKQADTPPAPPNLEEAEETPPQEEETEVPAPQAPREHETNPAPSSREEDAPMVASIDPGTELKPKRKILKAPASDSDMGNTCTRYQSIIPEESSKGVLFAAIEGHVEPGQKGLPAHPGAQGLAPRRLAECARRRELRDLHPGKGPYRHVHAGLGASCEGHRGQAFRHHPWRLSGGLYIFRGDPLTSNRPAPPAKGRGRRAK